jgi:predicted membrane protein
MSTETRLNLTPQLILGSLMIVFGVVLTLDRMELVDAARTLRFWPIVLIALGSWLVIERGPGGRSFSGYAMIIIGSLLLLNSLGIARVRFWELFWPALIILVGARLVMQTSGTRQPGHWFPSLGRASDGTAGSSAHGAVNMFSVLGSHQRAVTDKPFRGGEVTTIVGGTQLDLRQAEIAPGDEAVINVFVFMGGHEVWVPQGWTVVNDVMPILGGVEDKRLPPVVTTASGAANGPAPRLVLRGVVALGGLAIKN